MDSIVFFVFLYAEYFGVRIFSTTESLSGVTIALP